MKTCTKCRMGLPLTEFNADKSKRDGHRSWCRACCAADCATYNATHREQRAAYFAAYRTANPEKVVAASVAYYAAHREERATYSATYHAAHPEKSKARDLKRLYGLTPADCAEMLEQQGGLCVCELPATHVDHCHDCEAINLRGSVRGILCRTCNSNLDHFARCSPMHAAYLAAHAAVCPAREATA